MDTEKRERAMDIGKLREAAWAYYEGWTEDQKKAAREFFEAMDTDKSGNISIYEFTAFLSENGHQMDDQAWLFAELDKDGNGTLDLKELVTFYYIISRDEYKDLLNSRPSTNAPRGKAGSGGRTRGVNDLGQGDWAAKFSDRCTKFQALANSLGTSLSDLVTSASNSVCHIV